MIPLGNVVSIEMGQAPPGKACNKQGKGVPFVKAGEFGASRPVIREWTTDPKKFAKKTDVLVCVVGATCGKINLGEDCAIGRSVAALRPDANKIDQFYLHYFLHGTVEQLRSGSQGSAQTVISKAMLAELEIPLPPLEEQKRIVAVLDQAFAALDRARALAEANLTDLENLSASASRAVFDGVSGDRLKLGDLCEIYQPKTISAKDLKPDGAYIVFGANGPIGRYDKFNHEAPQLLVTCRGATCGSVNISEPFSWITGNAMVVSPKSDRISIDYLEQFFRGAMDWSPVITGAAQPQITRQSLAPTLVPVPERHTQDQQASALKGLQGKLSLMENQIKAKLVDIASLRQSILRQAFAGELT